MDARAGGGPVGGPKVSDMVDPVFRAMFLLRQRRFDDAIDIATALLEENPRDQAVWWLKCRALTAKAWVDDTEMEEEGVAEVLLDDNAMAQAPRPGTSLARPSEGRGGGPDQSVRPVTGAGRPLTGFARPGTSTRPSTGSVSVGDAFKGGRPGTSRPVTALGRQVRLGTASMTATAGGPFVNVDRLDLRKYARRSIIAKALCDYLLYVEHNPRKALELAAEATVRAEFKDWWWKARLGKCYYQLGLFRDAERQFKSALRDTDMIVSYLELCKVYVKLDQPNTAIDNYLKGAELHPGETSLLVGVARIYDMLNDAKGTDYYKKVLKYDASNVEAVACLASHHFYSDQPEVALRYYRRLLQMGVQNTELWNNIGLCCFYASQYDMTLSCFDRALALANDDNMSDVWYNVGQVAVGIGDLGLAYQAFKIAVSVDSNHAESYNNLGVLELRKGNIDQARSNFQTAQNLAGYMFEPFFNGALLAYKLGDFQDSYELVQKALGAYGAHSDSKELLKQLQQHFAML
uniref:Uncharacterized protein n=1 Tax=Bicosoecida sp. CB-2014 TaxID=1486930 RepID=A0A7S1CCY2_9STRA|mmetsp:Transcript_22088/g.77426  ORF Transcript_22088/g.77426 Transcript_22088/m.77426 type:complete len:519 (+) Transcript_22088:210-1766(+)